MVGEKGVVWETGILSRDELIEGYTSLVRNKAKATEEVDRILAIVDIN
jgi:calcium-dependent protein kinase